MFDFNEIINKAIEDAITKEIEKKDITDIKQLENSIKKFCEISQDNKLKMWIIFFDLFQDYIECDFINKNDLEDEYLAKELVEADYILKGDIDYYELVNQLSISKMQILKEDFVKNSDVSDILENISESQEIELYNELKSKRNETRSQDQLIKDLKDIVALL